MTAKDTAKGSSSASAAASSTAGGRGLNATSHTRNHRNTRKKNTEAEYRRELLGLLSGRFITLEYARNAWLQSMERDINRLKWELLQVEKAIWKGKKSKAAKKNPKKPAKEV